MRIIHFVNQQFCHCVKPTAKEIGSLRPAGIRDDAMTEERVLKGLPSTPPPILGVFFLPYLGKSDCKLSVRTALLLLINRVEVGLSTLEVNCHLPNERTRSVAGEETCHLQQYLRRSKETLLPFANIINVSCYTAFFCPPAFPLDYIRFEIMSFMNHMNLVTILSRLCQKAVEWRRSKDGGWG